MDIIKKLFARIFPLILILYIYSCDIFAPYDLELVGLSTKEINFDLFETEQQFVISYADSFDVKWSILDHPDWIITDPDSGVINIDNPDTVKVKLIRQAKSITGKFVEPIEISFHDKTNTEIININYRIAAIAELSTHNLNFDVSDSQKRFNLTSTGNYPYKWKFTSNRNWIKVQPDTGILSVDSSKFLSKLLKTSNTNSISDSIKVTIDKKELEAGNTAGEIYLYNVYDSKITDTIKVNVNKAADPLLSVSENNLDFGEDLISKKITVNNEGDGQISWTAVSNAQWLKISPGSGNFSINKTNTEAGFKTKELSLNKINSEEIEISVDRNGLQPGQYNSSIDIKSNGGDISVIVSMKVPEAPVISVTPASLDFGDSELVKRVQISNTGTGKLIWKAESAATWLVLTPQSDSISLGTQDLNVNVVRLGLQPGSYSSNIIINSNGGSSTIPVSMIVSQSPLLSVSAASFSFNENNKETTFEISNKGGGELVWQISTSESWISVSPANGNTTTEADLITVKINTNGLSAGTHTGNIIVFSDFGNETISVTLVINNEAKILVSPLSMDFGDNKSSDVFEIRNEGNADLVWQLSADQTWIEIGIKSGTVAPNQKNDIEVKINRTTLTPGRYSGNINITSNGGDQSIQVSMTISGEPKLSVNPAELNFGVTEISKSLEIKNEGEGNLNWQISSNVAWIKASALSGTLGPNESSNVDVTVDRLDLQAGEYLAGITVSSNGGNKNIPVAMSILENPILSVNPELLNFGENDSSKTIELKNDGTGNLNWQAAANETWISISKNSGTLGFKEKEDISVYVNNNSLQAGNYSADITISSNGGNVIIPVRVTVVKKAVLSVSQIEINFGEADSSKTFEIKNEGEENLNWQISEGASWLNISPLSGTLAPNQKVEIEVAVVRSGLTSGDYSEIINISSNGGSASLQVNMKIVSPKLSVSPVELVFADSDTIKTFEIINEGDGELIWELTPDHTWIGLASNNGSTAPNAKSQIQVKVNRNGLTPGDYVGSIKVHSNGGDEEVILSMTVVEKPELAVTNKTLDFGTSINSMTFGIVNKGTGTLNWNIQTPTESWISISPLSGSGDQTINVNIDRNLLSEGDHTYTISISSNAGNESVVVKVSASGTPSLSLSETSSVSVTGIDFGSSLDSKTITLYNIGTGNLSWSSEINIITDSPQGWVTLNRTSGTFSISQTITVTINRADLPIGQHNADIQIHSDGGNATIHLYVTESQPQLNVSTDLIEFNSFTEEKTFQISYSGSGDLGWSIEITSEAGSESIQIFGNPISGTATSTPETIIVKLQSGESYSIANNHIVGYLKVIDNNNVGKRITVKLNIAVQ